MGETLAQGYIASKCPSYDSNTGSLTPWPGHITIFLLLSFSHHRILLRTNRPSLCLLSFLEFLLASSFFIAGGVRCAYRVVLCPLGNLVFG